MKIKVLIMFPFRTIPKRRFLAGAERSDSSGLVPLR